MEWSTLITIFIGIAAVLAPGAGFIVKMLVSINAKQSSILAKLESIDKRQDSQHEEMSILFKHRDECLKGDIFGRMHTSKP